MATCSTLGFLIAYSNHFAGANSLLIFEILHNLASLVKISTSLGECIFLSSVPIAITKMSKVDRAFSLFV